MAWPLCMSSLESVLAAPLKSSRPAAKTDKADPDPADDDQTDKHVVRLNYVDAPWSKVLKEFAEATQTELVADTIPTKKFSRWDMKRHSRADALKILNQALQPENYRLQFKGHYLLLNHLKDFRHDYPAAVLRGETREESRRDVREEARPDSGVRHAAATDSDARPKQAKRGGAIRQASGETERRSVATREAAQQPVAEPVETTVKLKSRDALSVTKIMYKAFKPQAEEVDDGDGPQGLRGFLVRKQPAKKAAAAADESSDAHELPVQFSIGMDRNKNQLVVQATPQETKSIVRFIKTLDAAPKNSQTAVKAVKTKKDAGKLAAALQPQLNRLASETRKVSRQKAQPRADAGDNQNDDLNSEEEEPDAEKTPPRSRARRGAARGEADEEGARPTSPQGMLGSLKGEVRVESVPELGILVVTGNQNDVDAVMEVIEEIERLSKGTAPEVHLQMLRHVSSEALASLLTTVYERLGNVRNSAVQQTQAITVFPVSRPNAVLVVASKADMNNVINLIDDLDQPTDPKTEFMVYRLKYAVPGQVVDKIEAMYPPQTATGAANQQGTVGLIPRVRVIEDVRTNSVIVQARPRDLREVVSLIEDLDKNDSDSHHQIKIFPLNYAVADEVAFAGDPKAARRAQCAEHRRLGRERRGAALPVCGGAIHRGGADPVVGALGQRCPRRQAGAGKQDRQQRD